ncbi:MAG: DUF4339 domain-containing protein [Planctomycetota bacterium]
MADQWHVGKNGQTTGPFLTGQLKEMAAAGQVAPSDLLWKAGMEKWVPCSSVKGLFPVAGPPPLVEVQRDAMPYPATRRHALSGNETALSHARLEPLCYPQ